MAEGVGLCMREKLMLSNSHFRAVVRCSFLVAGRSIHMDHRPNNVKSEFVVQLRTGQSILNVIQRAHTPPQAVPPAQAGI
ncbi:hypothetical protein Y697_08760 [Mesotoga sp. BH458_6_3_2_1]|nr:hypothetical protein Y697_08760 [Mesotoga sp. BH458_6_3_2_1]